MKMCQRHWEMLKAAIDSRGLSVFIAKSSHQAVANVVSELDKTKSDKGTFDPLMGGYWAIVSNAIGRVGLALMETDEQGNDRCPLCFIQQEHDRVCSDPGCGSFEVWIERAADEQAERAQRLGLVAGS